MNDKCRLIDKVMENEFMVIDIGLFLDTHPGCTEAMEAYRRYSAMYDRSVNEYQREVGPLTLYDVNCDNYWTWIKEPWPWEMEAY